MNRTRREWGLIALGLAVGFMLGEVRQVLQPDQGVSWLLAVLTLGFLVLGFYLIRSDGEGKK